MNFNFHPLGKNYLDFCRLRNDSLNSGTMDLSFIEWFYPTTLLPLSIFCQEKPYIKVIPPSKPDTSAYYSLITGKWSSPGNTYLPVVKIPTDPNQRDKMLDDLYGIENGELIGGENVFKYVVGELVDNVYQHSKFSNAYIMAQRYPKKNFIDICIIDNGISIPQCLENAGYRYKDWEAIYKAANGLSTKKEYGRGWGLYSSLNLLTDGLNGKCLIVSRNGGLIAENEELYKLEGEFSFTGTLISVRVQYTTERVNIYDYIK